MTPSRIDPPEIQSSRAVRLKLAEEPEQGGDLTLADAARHVERLKSWNDWIAAECPKSHAQHKR